MGFVRVAGLADIEEGGLLGVRVGTKPVCLAKVEGHVYAFADNCTHRDFLLSVGELDPAACSVTCDWHGAAFNIVTGEVLSLPATRPIAVYPCRIENADVLVDIG